MDKMIQIEMRVPDDVDGFDILCLLSYACDTFLWGTQNAHLMDVIQKKVTPIKRCIEYSIDNELYRVLEEKKL